MTATNSKRHLQRFFNRCAILVSLVALIVLTIVVVVGIRAQTARFPAFLGNRTENIRHIKTTTDPNEFTFAVVGDVKCGTATFEEMLDILRGDKPAFISVLGDFVDHAEFASHKLFAFEMSEHTQNFPMLLVPGNHDIATNGPFRIEDFENTYGPAQFSFSLGNCLFVFLDVISVNGRTGQYLEFLDEALSRPTEKRDKTFVFMHIPPSELNSSLQCRELPHSEKFLRLAQKHRVTYVFAGDHHGYVKTEREGTTFIVTGGGGAKLRGHHGRFHHLVRMSVKHDMVTETVIIAKKQQETTELIERNIAVYLWPLLTYNYVSIAVTFVILGLVIWSLLFSLRQRKRLVKKIVL